MLLSWYSYQFSCVSIHLSRICCSPSSKFSLIKAKYSLARPSPKNYFIVSSNFPLVLISTCFGLGVSNSSLSQFFSFNNFSNFSFEMLLPLLTFFSFFSKCVFYCFFSFLISSLSISIPFAFSYSRSSLKFICGLSSTISTKFSYGLWKCLPNFPAFLFTFSLSWN